MEEGQEGDKRTQIRDGKALLEASKPLALGEQRRQPTGRLIVC